MVFFLRFFFIIILLCFCIPACIADSVVVFNEIMYHPAFGEDELEWVEFYNQMAVDVDISNWYVTGGIEFIFSEGTIVPGKGYLVLAISPGAFEAATGLTGVYGPFKGRLENAGERLELRNNNDRLMSTVKYDDESEVAADGSGLSLAKIDPNGSSSDKKNWTSSLEIGGTPGACNFPVQFDPGAAREGLVSYWGFDDEVLGGGDYFEDFDEPDGVPQDWIAVQGDVSIYSGWLRIRGGNGESWAWSGKSGVPLDYRNIKSVSFRVNYAGKPGDVVGRHGGVMLCASEPTTRSSASGYIIDWIDRTMDHGYRVYKSVNGTHSFFESGSGNAEPGNEWRIEFDDASFTVIIDGEQIGRYQDSSYRDGYIGFWCYSTSGQDIRFDDVNVEYTGTVGDTAGGGNHGVVGSGVTQVQGIIGTGGVSLENSAEAYVDVGKGKGNNFSVTGGITIEALISPEWTGEAGDYADIFDKEDGSQAITVSFQNDGISGNRDVEIFPAAQPVLSFGLNIGGVYSELDMPLDGRDGRPTLSLLKDGAAHHVAVSYNTVSGVKAIYVDGINSFSFEFNPGKPVASGGQAHAFIGNSLEGDHAFVGVIDEVAFWNRALTADEIGLHFENFKTGRNYFAVTEDENKTVSIISFNETVVPMDGAGDGWLELANCGNTGFDLQGGVVVNSAFKEKDYTFPAQILASGDYIVLNETQLGFDLAPGNKIFIYAPGKSSVWASVLLEEGHRARYPDCFGRWSFSEQETPGSANIVLLCDDIVISEIMYHPRGDALERGEYVELFNRGDSSVDLSGFSFEDGISYIVPEGVALMPGQYIVVARNPDWIKTAYGIDNVMGPYSGELSNRGERIALVDSRGNLVDEVRYFDGPPWPSYADGDGPSLELRDVWSDNNNSGSWASSSEAEKAEWHSYSYTGIAASNRGPTRWNEFVCGLLDDGEALIDDISVVESPSGSAIEFIQNGNFENGLQKWRLLGTHRLGTVIVDPGDPGNHVLHLIATGPEGHMHNHIETTYASNKRVVNGREYRISFRAKWLGGSNQLNTRLYFNRLPRTTLLEVPEPGGTPGSSNSVFEDNCGPVFSSLSHSPVVPEPGDEVSVSVLVEDPDGVDKCLLWWSLNGGSWLNKDMQFGGNNLYRGTVPGQGAGTVVQFFVEAFDKRGAGASCPALGMDSRALYKVNDGQAQLEKLHNLRIIMIPSDINFLYRDTNVMSNERLGATVVYDERDVYYNVGVRLRSSERGRLNSARVGFNVGFNRDKLFRGVHRSIGIDRSGGWGLGIPSSQDEILIKHIVNHAGGIPGMYDDIGWVIAPKKTQNGPALFMLARFGDVFLDSQWDNGSAGSLYNYELIYYPTTTVDGNPESLKRPQPDSVTGVDIQDLGSDKEVYRWFYSLENNRSRDDYNQFITFCKAYGAPTAQLEDLVGGVMDVNEWMRTFCIYSLCGVRDAYTYGNYHNLKLYVRPEDKKILAFPWDLDWCWTGGTTNNNLWGGDNLSRIIARPPFTRMYYRNMKDIIESTYNRTYMDYWVHHYGDLAGKNFGGVSSYISQRRSYILGRLSTTYPFEITTQDGNDFSVDEDHVEIIGNAPVEIADMELNGEIIEPKWSSISRWSVDIPLHGGTNNLEFVGLDLSGNVFATTGIKVTSTVGVPAIHIMLPTEGPSSGGTEVQIYGEKFEELPKVRFGDVDALEVHFLSSIEVTAISPPGRGEVVIVLENPDGAIATSPEKFAYIETGVSFRRGDANGDEKIDVADVITILSYLFSGSEVSCQDALDTNDDGQLNLADAISLLGYIFADGKPPAEPFENLGVDPTEDSLVDCVYHPLPG